MLAPAEFGSILRKTRRSLGLTQAEVALSAGVGLRFVVELEKGKPTCQIGKALLVAAALGIEVSLTPPEASV